MTPRHYGPAGLAAQRADLLDIAKGLSETGDAMRVRMTTAEAERDEAVAVSREWAMKAGEATAQRDEARADAKRLREREEHFARALSVADGGQYRNDWDGALRRMLAERDEWRDIAERRFAELKRLGDEHIATMEAVTAAAEAVAAERDEARRLLAAAARGELPRCDECPHAATQRMPSGDGWDHHACDAHTGRGWHDLPHADALRAAIGSAPREAAAVLTVRPAATQAERDRDLLSALAGALLVERAVVAEYAASEGRPWAERIAVKARLDAAREAVQARMAEGGR